MATAGASEGWVLVPQGEAAQTPRSVADSVHLNDSPQILKLILNPVRMEAVDESNSTEDRNGKAVQMAPLPSTV